MPTPTEPRGAGGLIWGLQRRLLVLLFLPLGLVGLASVYVHYRSAGTAAVQQDQQLLRLVPMLANSVVRTRRSSARIRADSSFGANGLVR